MTEPSVVTAVIDLRGNFQEVRDQGDRPTCLACATSDAHATFHNSTPLSAEFLFFHAIQVATVGNLTDGITFEEVAVALADKGQPAENEWPYSLTQPNPWTPPTVTKIWRGNLHNGGADTSAAIAQLIMNGQPVILGIRISTAFLSPGQPNFTIPADGDGFGGHAILVVGLGRDPIGQLFFLIRNSWGPSWANGGHAWLSADYLSNKLIGFASVVAHLKGVKCSP